MMMDGMINRLELPQAQYHKNIWLQVGSLIDGKSSAPVKDAHIVYNAASLIYAGKDKPASDLLSGQKKPDAHLPSYTPGNSVYDGKWASGFF